MNLYCDVLVVGAGTAGVPAAVAAARAGADTLLVEKRDSPGGTAVTGLHRYICGLYLNGPIPSPELLNGGLVSEIIEGLHQGEPGRRPVRIGKVDVLPYTPAVLQQVYTGLLEHESKLRVLYNATVTGIATHDRRIGVVEMNKAAVVIPRVVVDCSGDGVVITSSPSLHDVAPVAERPLAGLTLRVGGLTGVDDLLSIKVPYVVRQAVEAGALPAYLKFTTFTPGDAPGEGWCKLSFPPGMCQNSDHSGDETRRLLDCLKDKLAEFKNSRVLEMSPEVLDREGPRLKGRYTLTGEYVLVGRKFPDAVVRGGWPFDFWDQGRGPTYRYLEPGSYYEISRRCLRADALDNLLCAGRCISATSEAMGSVRVMGTCMASGQAAGAEAAHLSRNGNE